MVTNALTCESGSINPSLTHILKQDAFGLCPFEEEEEEEEEEGSLELSSSDTLTSSLPEVKREETVYLWVD